MSYFSTAITLLAVGIVLRYVLAAGRRRPRVLQDGTMVLKYPGSVAAIGGAAIGFGALAGVVTWLDLIPTTGDEALPYLVLGFVLLGLPLVLLERAVRVFAGEQAVRRAGLFGKAAELRWEEVRAVSFSAASQLVLRGERTRIRLNAMLVGFDSFVELLKGKLQPELYAEALRRWQTAAGGARRRG